MRLRLMRELLALKYLSQKIPLTTKLLTRLQLQLKYSSKTPSFLKTLVKFSGHKQMSFQFKFLYQQ